MADERTYDVIVFGATGVTGGLICEYLATRAGGAQPGRWAIAGRDLARLREVKTALERVDPACAATGIIVADGRDGESLLAMARQARVVLSTVGPYMEHGEAVVRACIAAGADYVDLTGETDFVDALTERCHESARERGVRIVSSCGFGSLPHDLGVLFTVGELPRDRSIAIEGFVRMGSSMPSRGSWRSGIETMGRMREHARRSRDAGDVPGEPGGRRVRIQRSRLGYDRAMRGWVFPLPTNDRHVVRRSALALERYGDDFRYAHHGVSSSLAMVVGGAAALGAVVALAQWKPTRNWLLARRASSAGPSAEERARGWFRVTFVGKAGEARVVTQVSGGDPGYGETAKMAAESALCLALDRDDLPRRAGVLTPAAAMGHVLIERLQRAGIRFEVLERS